LLDTAQGQRALAISEEPALLARMQAEEFVGRSMAVAAGRIIS
jgi:hypothetical protein